MTCARYSLAILIAATGLFIGSSTTEAASGHIDAYALRLQRQANSLRRELKYHYRHAPHFEHLMADARQVKRSAAHVHEVAHFGRDLQHLQEDLRELDRAIHHLNDLMREIEVHTAHCRNPRCGHFHGDIRPAKRLIHQMTETVHHLRSDVRQATAVRNRNHRYGHRGIEHGYNRYLGYRSKQSATFGATYRNRSNDLSYNRSGWTIRFGSGH